MSHYLTQLNLDYIEDLFFQYKKNPELLDPSWRFFFDGMTVDGVPRDAEAPPIPLEDLEHEVKAIELIQGFREMAYLIADVNPLDRGPKAHPLVELENFRLKESDLDKMTHVGRLLGMGSVPLREIVKALTHYYCSPIGVDIAHIEDPKARQWIQKRVEAGLLRKPVSVEHKRRALDKLAEAQAFETFIHKRFVGQKRFSIEGSDVLIPMLDYLIDKASSLGANEIIIGMAHRGRLNVLANIFQKDLKALFAEFSGNLEDAGATGDGDVKYHMGYSIDTKTFSGRDMHISLAPNPSHLEAINPVVMGIARSKQKLKCDPERKTTLAVLLHGDASFSGQGSVYEVLNMSELEGYTVGGVIHILVNNQIGFTTEPKDMRSTPGATDIAKMLEIPILRVNADEPDAALRSVSIALQYRYAFKRDVVIDLVGYRRYGHNEGDEPTFTQPLLYQKIDAHPRVFESYARKLISENLVVKDETEHMIEGLHEKYEASLKAAKQSKVSPKMSAFAKRWSGYAEVPYGEEFFGWVDTAVRTEQLQKIAEELLAIPPDFHLHPKIKRFLEERREMIEAKRGVDWSFAEALAFGSLLLDHHPVRLAGQDAQRGTFSQRHAVLYDVQNGTSYIPLAHLSAAKAEFEVVNSLLSEFGALGFEFGQSLANPNKLTLWEAQFGDFMNGAQIIIDQFLTCSAFKWQRYSGLVLLLPHGYEGQGPEHSSARLERFLQACAQNNIQVVNLTTPAQYFHALRRQLLRKFRLPLIIMSPKSLLRHPQAVSSLQEFQHGGFQELIDDPEPSLKDKAERLIFSSGKIYYELLKGRQDHGKKNVALIRLEQFYPFPKVQALRLVHSYKKVKDIVWCQEEPQNMGGWNFVAQMLALLLGKEREIRYVGRLPQASPAHGYTHLHQSEQEQIVRKALGEG